MLRSTRGGPRSVGPKPSSVPPRTARAWRRRTAAIIAMALAATPALALLPAQPASADAVRNTQLWVLKMLNVEQAWQTTEGQGVVVAVIDSGVNGNVSDLVNAVEDENDQPNDSGVDTSPDNPNWGVHGTWMASLIAGHGSPGGPAAIGSNGIVGTAPGATILSIRVITDPTDPNYVKYQHETAAKGQRELARAITYAVRRGAKVISMSLGYSQNSLVVRQALQDAYRHNVVVVASAGNSGDAAGADGKGQAAYSFPANYPGVLAVAAVKRSGQLASFSSENLSVQVAAPGYRVPAQGRDGNYWFVSGTSPACALTAGVVALIKSRYPRLTDSQVISAITSSTTRKPPGGYDQQTGFGVVDAFAALNAAGKLAAEGRPASVRTPSHFGGGAQAVPKPPVAPRGPLDLLLYCLLGAACLALVAVATSRLLAAREAAADRRTGPLSPGPLPPGPLPPGPLPPGPPARSAVAAASAGAAGPGAASAVAPRTVAPSTVAPSTGIPSTGVTRTGMPGTGIPGTGIPGTGVPGTGVPSGGAADGPMPSRPLADDADTTMPVAVWRPDASGPAAAQGPAGDRPLPGARHAAPRGGPHNGPARP